MRLDWTRRFQSSHGVLRMQVASGMCSGVVCQPQHECRSGCDRWVYWGKQRRLKMVYSVTYYRTLPRRSLLPKCLKVRRYTLTCYLMYILKKVRSSLRRFLRNKYSDVLYGTEFHHNRAKSVESTDGNLFTPLKYRMAFTPPIVTHLTGTQCYERLVYRILSETDRRVENGTILSTSLRYLGIFHI